MYIKSRFTRLSFDLSKKLNTTHALTRTNSFNLSRLYTAPISSPSRTSNIFETGYANGNVRTITILVMNMVLAPTANPCLEHMALSQRKSAKIQKFLRTIHNENVNTNLWCDFTEKHNQNCRRHNGNQTTGQRIE